MNGKQHGIGIFKKKNVSRQGLWENGERVKWLDETKENEVEVRKEPVEVLSFKKTES